MSKTTTLPPNTLCEDDPVETLANVSALMMLLWDYEASSPSGAERAEAEDRQIDFARYHLYRLMKAGVDHAESMLMEERRKRLEART